MSIKLKHIIALICLFSQVLSLAQNDFQMGTLPVLNINKKLDKGFKLNFKIESRQNFYKSNDFDLQYDRTDFAMVGAKKIGLNSSLAGGYMIRFKDDDIIQRLIQQFALVQKLRVLRLGHRFAADQTFEKDESVRLRLRYRITTIFPLSGQSLNSKEFYLKINNEYLNTFQKGEDYDLEMRWIALLGYVFTDNNKLEFGVDNRLSSFVNGNLKTRSWLSVAWYIAL